MLPRLSRLLRKFIQKPRFTLIVPALVWLVFFSRVTDRSLAMGVAFLAAGESMRLWADGYSGLFKVNRRGDAGQVGRLVTGGPYAFVRHPLYLGTFLVVIGFLVIGANGWAAAALLPPLILAYEKKIDGEERTLAAECPDFADYRDAVPRLVPGLHRYAGREGHWTPEGILASKEWKTAIWIAVLTLLLYLRDKAILGHDAFANHTLAVYFIFALILADAMASRRLADLRRGRSTRNLRLRRRAA